MSIFSSLQFVLNHPLNRNEPFNALLRFLRWQLGSRLIQGAIIHDWIEGARFVARTGDTGLTGNIYAGLHEFEDMAFVLHVLRPDDLFIDVGANVGAYTILACAVAGARGAAFEPVPATSNRLLENLRINSIENQVQLHQKGVGNASGVLRFTSGLDTMNHALSDGESQTGTLEVPVTTLDTAVDITSATIIKIDVEGYETPVLEGATRVLENPSVHAVVMELNGSGTRYGYDESVILAKMSGLGFEPFSYNP